MKIGEVRRKFIIINFYVLNIKEKVTSPIINLASLEFFAVIIEFCHKTYINLPPRLK